MSIIFIGILLVAVGLVSTLLNLGQMSVPSWLFYVVIGLLTVRQGWKEWQSEQRLRTLEQRYFSAPTRAFDPEASPSRSVSDTPPTQANAATETASDPSPQQMTENEAARDLGFEPDDRAD
ncbi:MAG: hypothetical protein O3A46_01125 [Candidatus Poribacteria bacterium]|nr:hypothetical protein [Candidatus Poribacteria bacterium]